MYPREELASLARHKLTVLHRIGAHREDCRTAAVAAVKPLVLLDRLVVVGRWLLPLLRHASGPATMAAACAGLFSTRPMRFLLTWAPWLLGIWATLRNLRKRL